MEEKLRIAERLIEIEFEPSRNAAELLAQAYQRMLATKAESIQHSHSVQEVPLLAEALR